MARAGIYDQHQGGDPGSRRAQNHELRGEMHVMRADIQRLDQKIDGVDRELRSAIDIRERLATLEARRA